MILVIILVLLVFLICFHTNTSMFSENNAYAVSFGGGDQNFLDAVDRVTSELNDTQLFTSIFKYTDHDLKIDKDFWSKHGTFIENNKRGYGYWIWKPYVIKKSMEKIKYGDTLFYMDSGCEVENKPDELEKIKLICGKYDMLYKSTGYNVISYTKMDILNFMNLNTEEVKTSPQYEATVILFKKTELTVKFVDDWYDLCCNYNLIDDSPSVAQNDPRFIENRHDQALFSLLLVTPLYKDRLCTPDNYGSSYYPIKGSRRRGK